MRTMKTEYIELGDIRMAYVQHGAGANLLLLHGNSGSKEFFKTYQNDLFSNFHSFATDSRGHGQSRSRDDVLSYEQMSMDILYFCRAKGISRTAMIGYSDGGNLALWLAVKAPEIFTQVAAISPNILASGSTENALRAIQKAVNSMVRLQKFGFLLKKQIMRFKLMLTDTGITDEKLNQITSKVLLLYAEKDMITEDHILHIAEQIPNCKLHKVMGCNHLTIPFQAETIKVMQDYLCGKA